MRILVGRSKKSSCHVSIWSLLQFVKLCYICIVRLRSILRLVTAHPSNVKAPIDKTTFLVEGPHPDLGILFDAETCRATIVSWLTSNVLSQQVLKDILLAETLWDCDPHTLFIRDVYCFQNQPIRRANFYWALLLSSKSNSDIRLSPSLAFSSKSYLPCITLCLVMVLDLTDWTYISTLRSTIGIDYTLV